MTGGFVSECVYMVVVTSGAADAEEKKQEEHENWDDRIFVIWPHYY